MTTADVIEAHQAAVDITAEQTDHEVWSFAKPLSITHYWSGELAPSGRHAEARLIWTDRALLARFECRQWEPLIVSPNPQTQRKTLGLWDRDVSEIFIAPDPEQINKYFEFEAAPTGEWIDLGIVNKPEGRKTDWDFESGMTASGRIAGNLITVAMRIPWSDLILRPEPGDEWRVNLCRCVGSGPDRGYLAWQPTRTQVPNFHVPEAFGRLRFD